ncbi:Cathepsin L-like protease [Operophtera brumata]|uniref:Cathepsin L-like protease n=1 Tax=Operophtera brumata TaxID=104452 RepID=A0A0L7L0U8_OPEBR|nr:Cathepsin L-like protease [Operophtera brumata]
MKCLAVLLCVVAAASAVSFMDLFKEEVASLQMEHKKKYESDIEDRFRMKIYAENKHKIAKHNQRFQKGLESYELKLNQYGDMLNYEFVHTMNGFNKTSKYKKGLHSIKGQSDRGATFIAPAHVTLPDQVDWRKKGAVTEIKDQGKCGSCWAFSTTGSLEGQHFRKTGYLVSLSEQNLIDCSSAYGNNGCEGGLMDNAFKYIKDNRGIDKENSYPYEGIDDKCRSNSGADDTGFVDVPEGDEKKLMAAVATFGPVSVAIDASHYTFKHYSSGVYYDENCSSTEMDHAVSGDYWLVKNSWSRTWGEHGYIKLARNRNNHCGIASCASFPLCSAVLLCVVAAASAASFMDVLKEEWNTFKMEHKKKYESDIEDRFRMKIYAENKHKIAKHNQRFQKGLESYELKQNKYGDMLHYEFVHTMNGFNKTSKHKKGLHSSKGQSDRGATFIAPAHVTLPDQVDWRKKGAVTEIKDQGKCGSCWAFSTTGALEGQHFRKAGYLVSLSEQNLVDCSSAYGNNGCVGGMMDNAFKYIKDNRGIDMENSYPYEGIDGKCRRRLLAREKLVEPHVGRTRLHQVGEKQEQPLRHRLLRLVPPGLTARAHRHSGSVTLTSLQIIHGNLKNILNVKKDCIMTENSRALKERWFKNQMCSRLVHKDT